MRLRKSVWPQSRTDAYLANELRASWLGYEGPRGQGPLCFVVRDGPGMVALAKTMPRIVATAGGETTIMGLAGVCVAAERRGEGLGKAVARAAFDRVDRGDFPWCLFQTSHAVQEFYARLGAVIAANRFVSSLGPDPDACPFWDEVVMRYPGRDGWPADRIDLLGPAY